VTVHPHGTPAPDSSTLNFGPGQTIANLATVALPLTGSMDLHNHTGTVDLIADVVGYYATT